MGSPLEQAEDRRRFRALLALCALSAFACRGLTPRSPGPSEDPEPAKMRVHFIDVGQGDATVLEFSCGLVLVDTGGEKNDDVDGVARVISTIDQVFAQRPELDSRLESLVLTHPHIDHTRGVETILERYRPKNIVTNGSSRGSGRYQQEHANEYALSSGAGTWVAKLESIGEQGATNDVIDPVDCVPVDPIITALWGAVPDEFGLSESERKNGNNHSVALRVSFGRASILLTGDLETAALERFVDRYEPSGLLDVDVYQVGHHGSNNGTTERLLRAMSPNMAVISMGPSDRRRPWSAWAYGHPRRSLIASLQTWLSDPRPIQSRLVATAAKTFEAYSVSKAIFATGWEGSITLEARSDGRWRVDHGAREHAVAKRSGVASTRLR